MKRIIIGQCYETLLKRIPPWPIVIAGEVNDWHGRHDDHLKERTVAKQDPMHARGRKWWWTHERLRRAYFRLVRLNRAGMLFAFCDPAVLKGGVPLPSATNQPEGGVNAVVKRALDHHRGLSEDI